MLDPDEHRLQVCGTLDGERWCWGLEKDLGRSMVDRDDPQPWAIDFLPRKSGALVAGAGGVLRAENNRGSLFELRHQVS